MADAARQAQGLPFIVAKPAPTLEEITAKIRMLTAWQFTPGENPLSALFKRIRAESERKADDREKLTNISDSLAEFGRAFSDNSEGFQKKVFDAIGVDQSMKTQVLKGMAGEFMNITNMISEYLDSTAAERPRPAAQPSGEAKGTEDTSPFFTELLRRYDQFHRRRMASLEDMHARADKLMAELEELKKSKAKQSGIERIQ